MFLLCLLQAKKISIYCTCVLGKVLYSLDSIWLLQADRRRLDGFHCRMFRRVLTIPHSYYSRMTNAKVLEKAGCTPLSEVLLARQAKLFKKIQRLPEDSLVRRLVCNSDGQPRSWSLRRSRGRPRQQWAHEVHKLTVSTIS